MSTHKKFKDLSIPALLLSGLMIPGVVFGGYQSNNNELRVGDVTLRPMWIETRGVKLEIGRFESFRLKGSTNPAELAWVMSDQFLDFSQKTNMEACVLLCRHRREHDLWQANIITAYSQVGCPLLDLCSEDFEVTDHHIHSHPVKPIRTLTKEDRKILKLRNLDENAYAGHLEYRGRSRVGLSGFENNHRPSEQDYSIGPGYLIASSGVIFFDQQNFNFVFKFEDYPINPSND